MKHKKTKARILSLALSALMLVGMIPTNIFAIEESISIGERDLTCHLEHDESCGYIEATEGTPAIEAVPCDMECTEVHAEDCAYKGAKEEIPAIEGVLCAHSCELCEEKIECICITTCDIDSENEEHIDIDCTVCNLENFNLEECKGKAISLYVENRSIAKREITLDVFNELLDKDGQVITSPTGIFDMLDSEGWKWDKNTKTLTLDGANIETTDRCAILVPDGATIILDGENTVKNIGTGNDATIALQCNGDVTFQGDGALTVNSTVYAAITSEGDITIEGGNVSAISEASNGVFARGSLNVAGGRLEAESKGNSPGIWVESSIDMTGGEISGVSAGSNGIGTVGKLSISGTSKVEAIGYFPGLYSVGNISISGESIVNSTGTNDTGLFAKGRIDISDSANVIATGNLYCGIQSNTDINISGGTVEANAPNDSAIFATNSIDISGDSKIIAKGKLCGLQSNSIEISGDTIAELNSKEDVAIRAKDNLTILENADVQAIGKVCGIYVEGDTILFSKNIEAKGIDHAAVCQANAVKDIMIGGKLTAESQSISAIYSMGRITTDENAEIKATGNWSGIQVDGNINITGSKIEAIGKGDDGIFSLGTITIDGGSIYAKGASGHAAIRSQNTQVSNEAAVSKINLDNIVGKSGAKVAFSDWNDLNGIKTSWTTFIAKDQSELIINEIGGIGNGLEEVWLGEPFEVTFDVNGGSGTNSKEYVYPNDKVTALKDEPTKDNTHFVGWYLDESKFDIDNTEITEDTTLLAKFDPHTFGEWITIKQPTTSEVGSKERTCTVCQYKQIEEIPKKSSGGGAGGSTTPSKPETPTTGEISTEGKIDSQGNTTVEITKDLVDSIIENAKKQAEKNGNKAKDITAIINVKSNNVNANTVSVNLPLTTQKAVIDNNIANLQLVIESPDIVLGMDLEAITKINEQAKQDVQLSATKVEKGGLSQAVQNIVGERSAFDITATTKDGKAITNLNSGKIKIELPYTLKQGETKNNIIGVYINDKGQIEYLKDSHYDQSKKSLIIYTNHLSIYAVGTKVEGYQDIIGHWAKSYIDQIVNLNLIDGISETIFAPDTNITREAFITALGRLEKIDEKAYTNTKFTDLGESKYAPYIAWAVEKGIVVGTSETTFSPTRAITREEIAVIIVNYQKAIAEELKEEKEQNNFADHSQIEQWARSSVEIVQKAGIMGGKEGNIFDPKGNTTRAEATVILSQLL